MKPGKIVSLIAGLAGAVAFIVAADPPLARADGDWLTPHVRSAALCGGIVAAICWIVCRWTVDRPLWNFRRQLADVGHDELFVPTSARVPRWLMPVHEAVRAAVARVRDELDTAHRRRREVELALRVAEADRSHAQAILHSISDAVLVTDAFNELWTANEAAGALFGFELPRAGHQPIDRIIHDPALVKLIRDARDGGETARPRRVEHRLSRNHRTLIFDMTLACVTNEQREVTGVVAVMRDITREREIADMKSDFVSGVSHELRTPLSSIKAYVEMLVDGEATDEQTRREFYNIIQSETNRLSRLIDNVLNISRIESGMIRVQREDVWLGQTIRDAMEIMQPQAHGRQISLAAKLPAEDCLISADKDMILQSTLNLISNAIKYTPSGGSVRVELGLNEQQSAATLSVIDNGVGVPEEDLPHIWDKFYRVPEHKKIAKGTGLGLNLVKHVVETVHEGRIGVQSRVGEGSTFTITLPLADMPARGESRPAGWKGAEHEQSVR